MGFFLHPAIKFYCLKLSCRTGLRLHASVKQLPRALKNTYERIQFGFEILRIQTFPWKAISSQAKFILKHPALFKLS